MLEILRQFSREILDGSATLKDDLSRSGIPSAGAPFLAAAVYASRILEGRKWIVLVAADNQEAEQFAAESAFYLGEEHVVYFPGFSALPYEYALPDRRISLLRMRGLSRILDGEPALLCTSPEGLSRGIYQPEAISAASLQLKLHQTLESHDLMQSLFNLGYDRSECVETPGEFCPKGSVLDIFPANLDLPIRLEFLDDELESMRVFDPETQIGGEKISTTTIAPAGEIVFSGKDAEALRAILSRKKSTGELPSWVADGDADASSSVEDSEVGQKNTALSILRHGGLQDLAALMGKGKSLLDCFDTPPSIIVYPAKKVREHALRMEREFDLIYEAEREKRICPEPQTLLCERLLLDEAEENAQTRQITYLDEVPDRPDETTAAPLLPTENFRGRIAEIRDLIVERLNDAEKILIVSPYAAQIRRIAGIFADIKEIEILVYEEGTKEPLLLSTDKKTAKKTAKKTIHICRAPLRNGFRLPDSQLYILSDADIFGRGYRKRSRFKSTTSSPLASFMDLKENDHVVHINHGVGKFIRLERVAAAGRERDFLVLEYADEDRLYVPLEQISLVQRYAAPTEKPRLDSLGKSSFKRIKKRVEERVEELAKELIQIYAVRMSQKGFSFPPDTAWQEEFESEFVYDETPDQLLAIEAVKNDMESERPMDRLVCGDVGFGKTEIAIRAAFKSALAGKQTALIAPTTILALQHFRTFNDRFINFPVKTDWISRFRSPAEIREVRAKTAKGEIDILIGTHALLSGETKFKNLGLLIVDEEQRFGVAHKEAIKNLRKLVDVLTLSATPIPRTLHMSLVGIRDLSVIRTPPADRLPIFTYVLEEDDAAIKEAVERELERGGQIFFLHNHIETIELAARRIHGLVPRAGYAILHGQMAEDEVEDVLLDFLEGRYDILVTTTIIESGIDMPNVNTLIVDRADLFGLSQLYQIRGRVGRSNRQAYAYLFYPTRGVLSEKASKRLNTIQEYQELGSGFKIAMRDLEIRGAGNILGSAQSGDIMDVGFELYVKLLEDAVKRLQGTSREHEMRARVNIHADYYLAEDYIADTRQRIEFYKRFEAALSVSEVDALENEMRERFGETSEQARIFSLMHAIRVLASVIGFESVSEEDKGSYIFQGGAEPLSIPARHILAIVSRTSGLSLNPKAPNALQFQSSGSDGETRLQSLRQVLIWLAEAVPVPE